MKKKYIGIALAAMMMAQPVLVQGSPSPGTGTVVRPSGDRDNSSSSSSKPLDTSGSQGALLGGGGPSGTILSGGISMGTGLGGSMAGTENVTTGTENVGAGTEAGNTGTGGGSSSGNALRVGDTQIRVASNEELKETFTPKVVETINTINSGTTPLYRAIGTPEVVGYNPLVPVQTLVTENVTTQTKTADPVSVTLYVPNLIEGLSNVQLLYYDNVTKKWEFMSPTAIDYATKQISVTLSGDTPFTVVYKNS